MEKEPERVVFVGYSEQDDRDHRVVRRAAVRGLAVGDAGARRRPADRPEQRRRLPVREDRRALAGSHHRHQRRHETVRLRKASELAPTIPGTQGGTDYFSPWEDQTLLVAQALGREAQGQQLIEGITDAYAQVATFSQNGFYDGLIYVYPDGLGTEFLSMLGFTVNPDLAAPAKPGEQAAIPSERLDVIDTDVLVIDAEKPEDIATLEKVPTYKALDVVKQKRVVYTDPVLSGAMYFMTPLSLQYVLEHLPAGLKNAVAGESPAEIVGAA